MGGRRSSIRLGLSAVQWLVGASLLSRMAVPSRELTSPSPTLSVIIPARDEAGSLPHLLASLRDQTFPPTEVLVVDDHSEDETAVVAEQGGATVITAPERPAGWTGKPAACAHGRTAATGDLLAFIDADVVLGRDALALTVGEWQARGGLVSVQPFHRTVRPYEQLSGYGNLVAMMGTLAFTPRRRQPVMAFGPFLLTSAADYDQVGGHAHPGVRASVVEDAGLARAYRTADRPVHLFAGAGVADFRMYPEGPVQLYHGWNRSIVAGARAATPLGVLLPFLWIWGGLDAARAGLRAIRPGPRRARIIDGATYLAWALQLRWLLRRIGRWSRLSWLAFPVPLSGFVSLSASSAVQALLRRPARWKGRRVDRR